MKTDYTPHYPQEDYLATITLTGTRSELVTLYNLLQQAEPCSEYERRIHTEVLSELSTAQSWIAEMEDIYRRLTDS